MAAQAQPLTKPPRTRQTAWSALVSHYKTVSKLHLQHFLRMIRSAVSVWRSRPLVFTWITPRTAAHVDFGPLCHR